MKLATSLLLPTTWAAAVASTVGPVPNAAVADSLRKPAADSYNYGTVHYRPPLLPWVRAPFVSCSLPWAYLLQPRATLKAIEARCGTRRTCEAFERDPRHGGSLSSRRRIRQLRQRYGFLDQRQCLKAHQPDPDTNCRGVLKRIVKKSASSSSPSFPSSSSSYQPRPPVVAALSLSTWTPDVLADRAAIYAACGEPAFFCTLFNRNHRLSGPLARHFGYGSENKCRCDEALERMTSTDTNTVDTVESVDGVCGSGVFCNFFDLGRLPEQQASALRKKYEYRSAKQCRCDLSIKEMLVSRIPNTRPVIDAECGKGFFCEVFNPSFAMGEADLLAEVYGYRSQQQCIAEEAIKERKEKKWGFYCYSCQRSRKD